MNSDSSNVTFVYKPLIIGTDFDYILPFPTSLRRITAVTAYGGGGTHLYHPTKNRKLTCREIARLCTFPDDFVFFGSRTAICRQLGNSVPPAGIRVIAQSLRQQMAGEFDLFNHWNTPVA